MEEQTQIIAFYEFKQMTDAGPLDELRSELRTAFTDLGVRGTIIIADEGYNGMVCGSSPNIGKFIVFIEELFDTRLKYKSSFHASAPFRKIDVKIKREIVTLKQDVDISLGRGTHVKPEDWNQLISDPETILLDTRNDYEFQSGTFHGAINPGTTKFSELPAYVAEHFDPEKHKRIAMFCTGGIRCEKFAPYMKQIGFDEVYQLEGGILKYLEETPVKETLWEGECFVFDERVTVDANLQKGTGPDHSQRLTNRKKAQYKVAE